MPSSSRPSSAPSPAPPAPPGASAQQQQVPAFANMLPHAGHHADLQLINSMVNELCEVHTGNRKAMDEMIAKYEELRLSYEEATFQNAAREGQSSQSNVQRAEHEQIKAQLRRAEERKKEILESYDDLASTNNDYEDVMASMMIKVREFADAHTTTLIAWHKYYNAIIQGLRDESLQKSLEHSRWQDSLGRLNTYVREAHRSYSEESNPLYEKIAYLKRENRVMKTLLDWPESDPDSDTEREQADEALEDARKEMENAALEAKQPLRG